MNESKRRGSFAFYLQILLLLLIFLGVCAVLLQTFAAAAKLSRRARAQNDGMAICRNAAEAFAAAGTLSGTIERLGGSFSGDDITAQLAFDETLAPADNGCYCLTATVTQQQTESGMLALAHLEVTDAAGDICAALDTERYLPDTKGGSNDAA